MKHLAREFVLYSLAMGAALSVDIGCLALLVEVGGLGYIPAAVLAFLAGNFVAYLLCVRFIFRYRRVSDRRIEVLTFVALGAVGLAVNLGVMIAAVELLSLHYLLGKVLAAGVSFVVNYASRRLLLFTQLYNHPSRLT